MGSSGKIKRQRNACGQGKLRSRTGVYGWEQTWAAAAGAVVPGGRQQRRLLVVDSGGGAWCVVVGGGADRCLENPNKRKVFFLNWREKLLVD
jgi:hypothetical protein